MSDAYEERFLFKLIFVLATNVSLHSALAVFLVSHVNVFDEQAFDGDVITSAALAGSWPLRLQLLT